MKKRYHTLQKNLLFRLIDSASTRAKNEKEKNTSRGFSKNSASKNNSEEKLVKSSITQLASWETEEDSELKLENELSKHELNDFSLSCIESLANLAQKMQTGFCKGIKEELTEVVHQKLISFEKLAQESKLAKIEFRESAARTRELITNTQPMINPSNQLTAQMVEFAERAMCQKYRSAVLGRRVEFLVEAVANYVGEIGTMMGLPQPLMGKVSQSVRAALADLSK